MELPLVSILVPVVNEEADIAGCLDAISAQTYPADRMELLVVDGASEDRTVAVVRERSARLGLQRTLVIENPERRTSTSLNVGLAEARGDLLVRLDARSRVGPAYVARIVEVLTTRDGVGVAGGAQIAKPRSARAIDEGIARALSNRWGTGLARYRRSATSGPADTVWMGAFRTDELRAIGGWNPAVALNEDFELNTRFRRAGALVWFDASLRSGYLPRASLAELARQYFRFGRVKGTWWARDTKPNGRQVGLLVAPIAALAGAVRLRRRLGWTAVITTAVGGALVVDYAGAADHHARPSVRGVSIVAMALVSGAWWIGVVLGFAGETVGVRHSHG